MSFFQFISSMPPLVPIVLLSALLLALLGWMLSIRAGFRSEKGKNLIPHLIFPLTSPFALLFLLTRHWRTALPPLLCYLLAFSVIPLGGNIAQRLEIGKLDQYKTELQNRGESLQLDALKPAPVPDESNVWMHPFLHPIALAGQPADRGKTARRRNSANNSPYKKFSSPRDLDGLDYSATLDESPRYAGARALRAIHATALEVLSLKDGAISETNTPASWEETAKLIADHYQPAADATRQLEEALNREHDQYPYAWEESSLMLLPHLSYLKTFTKFANNRSQAAAAAGNAEETFRMLRLSFQLAETGDSDLFISRLVQIAQIHIALSSILAAQQFHIGNDAQWQSLAALLERWDLPALIPDSLRAERSFGNTMMGFNSLEGIRHSIYNKSLPELIQFFDEMGGGARAQVIPVDSYSYTLTFLEAPLLFLADLFFGGHARAHLTCNWRVALTAYEEMIANIEATFEKTQTAPWNQGEVPALKKPLAHYGFLAQMVVPLQRKVFEKALQTQHHIELAKIAVALERHYLAHQAYPKTLAALAPRWLPAPPIDPMTHQPWKYQRLETTGFLLYSIGKDGIDHNGTFTTRKDSSDSPLQDDLGWRISPTIPDLPQFTIKPNRSANRY